jgi:hypothetical protein
VQVAPLGTWLVAPPLLSAFVALPMFVHWEFSSLPHPCSLGQVQHSIQSPLLLSVLDYCSLFMLFIFVGSGVQSAQELHWIM